MDKHTLQMVISGGLAGIVLAGTVAIIIIQTFLNRPVSVPDVLVNLDILAATAFFVNAAVQNGARSAGQSAAQIAVAAAQNPNTKTA